jgi:hypothetical protein
VQRTSLTGVDGLTSVCDPSDRCQSVSELCCFSLQFVCGCFGGKCGLFLGSVALQWLCALGKLEEFEAEVILGF